MPVEGEGRKLTAEEKAAIELIATGVDHCGGLRPQDGDGSRGGWAAKYRKESGALSIGAPATGSSLGDCLELPASPRATRHPFAGRLGDEGSALKTRRGGLQTANIARAALAAAARWGGSAVVPGSRPMGFWPKNSREHFDFSEAALSAVRSLLIATKVVFAMSRMDRSTIS